MKSRLLSLSLLLLLTATACQKNDDDQIIVPEFDIEAHNDSLYQAWDSITISLRNDVINGLNGIWTIDSIEIEFQNSYSNSQIGISSDTTLIDFGEIVFGEWSLSPQSNDSTSFENKASLIFDSQSYPISFDYLIYVPEIPAVYSFLTEDPLEIDEWQSNDNGWFIKNLGLLDNIQIDKINEDEFYLIGLNRGIKKMKLKKK